MKLQSLLPNLACTFFNLKITIVWPNGTLGQHSPCFLSERTWAIWNTTSGTTRRNHRHPISVQFCNNRHPTPIISRRWTKRNRKIARRPPPRSVSAWHSKRPHPLVVHCCLKVPILPNRLTQVENRRQYSILFDIENQNDRQLRGDTSNPIGTIVIDEVTHTSVETTTEIPSNSTVSSKFGQFYIRQHHRFQESRANSSCVLTSSPIRNPMMIFLDWSDQVAIITSPLRSST